MKTLTFFLLIVSALIFMSFTFISNTTVITQDRWMAPTSAKEIKNPFTGDASIAKGKSIYQTRCVVCHGAAGAGDGPAGKSLVPPATDFASDFVKKQTDGELFWKISEGRGAMVGWKLTLSEEERWALINYIRTLAN